MRYLSFILFIPAALGEELENVLQRLILSIYTNPVTNVSCVKEYRHNPEIKDADLAFYKPF